MYTRYKSKKGFKKYILATYWNLSKENLVIWKFFFSKYGEFGPFFSMKTPLHRSDSLFSGRNLAKNLPKKKHGDFIQCWVLHFRDTPHPFEGLIQYELNQGCVIL
jgi:hypothetical protein